MLLLQHLFSLLRWILTQKLLLGWHKFLASELLKTCTKLKYKRKQKSEEKVFIPCKLCFKLIWETEFFSVEQMSEYTRRKQSLYLGSRTLVPHYGWYTYILYVHLKYKLGVCVIREYRRCRYSVLARGSDLRRRTTQKSFLVQYLHCPRQAYLISAAFPSKHSPLDKCDVLTMPDGLKTGDSAGAVPVMIFFSSTGEWYQFKGVLFLQQSWKIFISMQDFCFINIIPPQGKYILLLASLYRHVCA